MIPLAHSGRKGKSPQSYRDHVAGVVSAASQNVKDILPFVIKEKAYRYLDIVEDAAIHHDLGKLGAQNQAVLNGKQNEAHLPVEHRDAGVKHLIGSCLEKPSATLVYAHHRPGLPNLMEQKTRAFPFRFPSAMADSDANIQEYIALHRHGTKGIAKTSQTTTMSKLSAIEYRVLLSCLVDADYSDTAGEQLSRAETRWLERLEQLDCYIKTLREQSSSPDSVRNQLRCEFYDCCRNAPTTKALEYCDSPVGTGKTTAVLAHMLKSAEENGLRHIFVVLPYTNIISQTVEVLQKALVLEGEKPTEIVAEHHHQADFESIELRHLAITWTAPIIVTTAVQFFETLASNVPSKLRKLHQLPGSSVIIDESHAALPLKLMPLAWKWITELTQKWGCHFCLCSGTSFKFWENQMFTNLAANKVNRLLTDDLSGKLDRFETIRIYFNAWKQDVPHFENASALVSHLEQFHGSRLIVLNTVRSAAYLAKVLRNSGHDVLHLSTALTPHDRENIISKVKWRLKPETNYNGDWTLVATSCVECGMDFSFHYGFCELRSLQSYLQLGGRINRNGEYEDGSLICFTVTDDGFGYNPSFDIPKNVFRKQIQSGQLASVTITQAVTESFDMECKEMGGLTETMCRLDKKCAFVDVAENFRVIPEETITVVADSELAEKLRKGTSVSARELQRGSVNLRRSVIEKLGLANTELPVLSNNQYDGFLGYMKNLL